MVLVGDILAFTYSRNAATLSGDWLFTVEWSETLEDTEWTSGPVAESIIETIGDIQTVRAELPAGTEGRRFVRLRVHR